MITLNKIRRLFETVNQLGIYSTPLLNTGYDGELIAEFWEKDKYLSITIYDNSLEIFGTKNGVDTPNCIEKGWLYE